MVCVKSLHHSYSSLVCLIKHGNKRKRQQDRLFNRWKKRHLFSLLKDNFSPEVTTAVVPVQASCVGSMKATEHIITHMHAFLLAWFMIFVDLFLKTKLGALCAGQLTNWRFITIHLWLHLSASSETEHISLCNFLQFPDIRMVFDNFESPDCSIWFPWLYFLSQNTTNTYWVQISVCFIVCVCTGHSYGQRQRQGVWSHSCKCDILQRSCWKICQI